jgi:signal transduction histidine kinase
MRDERIDLQKEVTKLTKNLPGIETTLDVADDIDATDQDCAHVARRCVQESITNTLKHAGAKHLKLTMTIDDGDLVIVIEDDGEKAGKIQPGHGLRGMRERIEELGGNLEITTAKGKGTTIRASLPRKTS